jgi:hypothetical protein
VQESDCLVDMRQWKNNTEDDLLDWIILAQARENLLGVFINEMNILFFTT